MRRLGSFGMESVLRLGFVKKELFIGVGVFTGSSSIKVMSDSGLGPVWLRELRKLCKLCILCTDLRSSRSSSVDLNALITRSWKTQGGRWNYPWWLRLSEFCCPCHDFSINTLIPIVIRKKIEVWQMKEPDELTYIQLYEVWKMKCSCMLWYDVKDLAFLQVKTV